MCVVTILIVIFMFSYVSPSFASQDKFRVFKVEADHGHFERKSGELIKDFYINGGESGGLKKAMLLDIYRYKTVMDGSGIESEVHFHIGKVKLTKVFKDVSLARQVSLVSSPKSPVLQYTNIMIGDYALKKADKKPAIKGVKKLSSGKGVIIPSNVLFGFNEWRLKKEARKVLSEVYDIYNKNKDKKIVVSGHTCSLGTEKYNLELSRKRASSVRDYLINTKGISKKRISIKYLGENDPIESNSTKKGRASNRRVEIEFL